MKKGEKEGLHDPQFLNLKQQPSIDREGYSVFPAGRDVISDESLTLDTTERSRVAQTVVQTSQELSNAERFRRAREKDLALGVFCGFPYLRVGT